MLILVRVIRSVLLAAYFLCYAMLGAALGCCGWLAIILIGHLQGLDEHVVSIGFLLATWWGTSIACIAAWKAKRSAISHLSSLIVAGTVVVAGMVVGSRYHAEAQTITGWERLGPLINFLLLYLIASIGVVGVFCGLFGLLYNAIGQAATTIEPPPSDLIRRKV